MNGPGLDAGGGDAIPPIPMRLQGGDGPDLVLIHGFGADRMSWLANAPALAAGAKVFALDLPGHGAAGPEVGDGRIESLAAAVEAALERQAMTRVTLMGHSLGGGIALIIAARRPDLVDALVLIAPAGLGRGVDPAFLRDYPRQGDSSETEALLRRLVARPTLVSKPLVALVQKQLAMPGARDALAHVAAGIGAAGPPLREAVHTVVRHGTPRLTIWGEADRINPLDDAALATLGGERLLIPDVGHLPHVEAASAVNTRVVRFLRDHRPG